MLKAFLGGSIIKETAKAVSDTYNYLDSKHQISAKRKKEIEERRSQLKIEKDDSPILIIIVEEMLSYRATVFTLDDRYLQLEQILEAIDKARKTKNTNELITLCQKLAGDLSTSSSTFKNVFLERLECINTRVKARNGMGPPKAKL